MDGLHHNKQQKDKARKRGASLKNKGLELGEHCEIFTAVAYWDPTHKRMEAAMFVPKHQAIPDLNEVFGNLDSDGSYHVSRKKRSRGTQSSSKMKRRRRALEQADTSEAYDPIQPRRTSQRLKQKTIISLNNETPHSATEPQNHESSSLADCEFELLDSMQSVHEALDSHEIAVQSVQLELDSWPVANETTLPLTKTQRSTTSLARKVIQLLEELVPSTH
ncbi:hypothetical protein JX265_013379 [Neoarthrinium moseri]|uniref:Uncharacterized protein n=1 Tax=Neoarthrinium moseri TaxID=1658444 RepID=A0A9P9W8G6_9PEZI|nr:uncharacterized protein JN550_013904 [Neoarthrinium moseri]KAI1839480.1 hypothetical protein JX266_014309 [Neoarthrinium moseri]KAI1850487.1 hypothetical protein JX265_013379 [Neoarthrinium moseri]KAI1856085.1 hypothetical protein JN550_013904 [Neoarthrinium moseri]